MEKNAFSFIVKSVYLLATIFFVAVTITRSSSFSSIINTLIIENIDPASAQQFAYYLIGEEYPEPYELLAFNCEIFFISIFGILLFCTITIIIKVSISPISLIKMVTTGFHYFFNVCKKFFSFILLIWLTFRLLPYDNILSANLTLSPTILGVIVVFHVSAALFLYVLMQKITKLNRRI